MSFEVVSPICAVVWIRSRSFVLLCVASSNVRRVECAAKMCDAIIKMKFIAFKCKRWRGALDATVIVSKEAICVFYFIFFMNLIMSKHALHAHRPRDHNHIQFVYIVDHYVCISSSSEMRRCDRRFFFLFFFSLVREKRFTASIEVYSYAGISNGIRKQNAKIYCDAK